jgi:hypothetical protein
MRLQYSPKKTPDPVGGYGRGENKERNRTTLVQENHVLRIQFRYGDA